LTINNQDHPYRHIMSTINDQGITNVSVKSW
jgi:hypothetical protein